MSETDGYEVTNNVTGERRVDEWRPSGGRTEADVQAFLADRKEAAKLINPQNCDVVVIWGELLDVYGLYHVPDDSSCIEKDLFVRNLPDGSWVWFGDLPEEICNTLEEMLKKGGAKCPTCGRNWSCKSGLFG
jgi:hypothetical protein